MRRDGPKPGVLIAADPATVERSGSCRPACCGSWPTVRMGGRARGSRKPEKPLAWHHDLPGLDASFSTNRPPFHDDRAGKARRIRRRRDQGDRFPVRLDRSAAPASQETCHACRAMSPPKERTFRCQHGGCHGTSDFSAHRRRLLCCRHPLWDRAACAGNGRALMVGDFFLVRPLRSRRRAFGQIALCRAAGRGSRPRSPLRRDGARLGRRDARAHRQPSGGSRRSLDDA